jgi:cytochrome c-type biogenesis protein CcmH/NrfG
MLTTLGLSLVGCDKLRSYSDAEHVQRAKDFQEKGNVTAAIIELRNALQKNPKNPEARWLLGDAYTSQGFGKEAEKELLQAQELGLKREALKVSLGMALLEQREYGRVLKEI